MGAPARTVPSRNGTPVSAPPVPSRKEEGKERSGDSTSLDVFPS